MAEKTAATAPQKQLSREELQQMLDAALAENQKLTARIAELEKAQKQAAEDEKLIIERMAKGLSRQQAIAVIQRQREFDAAKKKQAASPQNTQKTQK